MEFFLDKRGQTSVEYLMLMALAFITTYIVITGPLSLATRNVLAEIRLGIQNTVRNGEWKSGQVTENGAAGHPGDERRFRALHL